MGNCFGFFICGDEEEIIDSDTFQDTYSVSNNSECPYQKLIDKYDSTTVYS